MIDKYSDIEIESKLKLNWNRIESKFAIYLKLSSDSIDGKFFKMKFEKSNISYFFLFQFVYNEYIYIYIMHIMPIYTFIFF